MRRFSSHYTHLYFAVAGLLLLAGALLPGSATSHTDPHDDPEAGTQAPKALSAFRQFLLVDSVSVEVPTVVEVPLDSVFLERPTFAVYDQETGEFLPHFYQKQTEAAAVSVTSSSGRRGDRMVDGDYDTYAEFPVTEDGPSLARIVLETEEPITSSGLTVSLADNVALPNTVEVTAGVAGLEEIVVAERELESSRLDFPRTRARRWTVTFTHSQPLRISELALRQEGAAETFRALRFLYQPGHSYRLYLNPDRSVSIKTSEAPDLRTDTGVRRLAAPTPRDNPRYAPADVDDDGVPDTRDNCVRMANPEQTDTDGNGRGDVCDDWDRDGVVNSKDNCVEEPNRGQRDTDGDGIGDACDDEESRVTERYPWLVWLGLGIAGLVLIGLFAVSFWHRRPEDGEDGSGEGGSTGSAGSAPDQDGKETGNQDLPPTSER